VRNRGACLRWHGERWGAAKEPGPGSSGAHRARRHGQRQHQRKRQHSEGPLRGRDRARQRRRGPSRAMRKGRWQAASRAASRTLGAPIRTPVCFLPVARCWHRAHGNAELQRAPTCTNRPALPAAAKAMVVWKARSQPLESLAAAGGKRGTRASALAPGAAGWVCALWNRPQGVSPGARCSARGFLGSYRTRGALTAHWERGEVGAVVGPAAQELAL
jgi:hypothetical protein